MDHVPYHGPARLTGRDPSQHELDGHRGGYTDPTHDPDHEHYRLWREEHARQLDEDYRAWRDERYRQFCSEFDRWRAERGRQHLHHERDDDPTPEETPSLSIGP